MNLLKKMTASARSSNLSYLWYPLHLSYLLISPQQAVPPPVITPIVVPTSPPVMTKPNPTKPTGPATRAPESLIIGQVVDTGGRPVPQAVVRLLGDRVAETTLADAKGRFYFRSVPLGELVVTAQKTGYFDGGYGQRRANGLPMPFSLPFGQVIPNMRIELYRAGVITGSIRDTFGEPVVGARVVALQRQFVSGEWKYAAADRADTDDTGTYRLFGLRPGEYLVVAPSGDMTVPASRSAPGMTPPDVDSPPSVFPTVFYSAAQQRLLSLPIALRPGEVRYAVNFTLAVVRTHRVSGQLTGDPAAIGEQRIRIVPVDAGWDAPDAIAETLSAPDGTFSFDRLPAGSYLLLAGNMTAAVRTVTAAAGDAAGAPGEPQFCAHVDVVVQDEDLDLGNVEMLPTSAIAGEIRFEPGATGPNRPSRLERAAITIEPAGFGLSHGTTVSVRTDRPFALTNLVPGDYFIRVDGLPAGWFLKSIESGAADAMDSPIAVRGEDVRAAITLTTRSTEVVGTVRDARLQFATGAAVIIVPVLADGRAIWTPNRVRETRTSTSGVFTVRGLPPGDYLVVAIDEATADGWQDPKRLAALRPLATRFRLQAADTVSLVLTIK